MPLHTVTIEIGGRPLSIETGKLAKQASGSVVVRQGDSAVLVTAVADKKPGLGDFVPLSCEYQDRTGAYGRIPGGYFKREGRANERETLVGRLMDRPIRPQFPKTWRFETQVIATVLSFDVDNDTDVLALCGASAALMLSDIPVKRAIAGVRVALHEGALIINPANAITEKADLNLVVAGTREAICMVEGGGQEVSETVMLEAMDVAHAEIRKIIDAIEELKGRAGQAKREAPAAAEPDKALMAALTAAAQSSLPAALSITGKHERRDAIKAAREAAILSLVDGKEADEAEKIHSFVVDSWEKLVGKAMRAQVLEQGRRIDGRATDEIRAISGEVSVSPRAHGSAVFTRGETQAFVTAALGVEDDAQRLDHAGMVEPTRRWMLTYNFPPFCTGEARRLTGPRRREVGHGALAHRAIAPMLPSQQSFPYVLRCTSDVLESNGSSSMATVCGSTLALMDAGVPMKAPVAGIAMGLIKEGDQFAVLSDILGDEDHLGDMDFKVTGTRKGITAFQMDTKIDSVPREIMHRALSQAREGRIYILDEMAKVIKTPRTELSRFAPRITTIHIKTDKIRDIIGPGGRTIRGIQEQCGVRVSVDDSGKVDVASTDVAAAEKAIGMIRELTQEAEIGKMYLGVVKRVVEFGAFVEIFPGTEGLVHISHLAKERIAKVTDVVQEGDEVLVRVIDIDKAGKIRLSRKEALDASSGL